MTRVAKNLIDQNIWEFAQILDPLTRNKKNWHKFDKFVTNRQSLSSFTSFYVIFTACLCATFSLRAFWGRKRIFFYKVFDAIAAIKKKKLLLQFSKARNGKKNCFVYFLCMQCPFNTPVKTDKTTLSDFFVFVVLS